MAFSRPLMNEWSCLIRTSLFEQNAQEAIDSQSAFLFLLRCFALLCSQTKPTFSFNRRPSMDHGTMDFIRRWAAIFLTVGNGIFCCKWSSDRLLLWLGLIFIGRQTLTLKNRGRLMRQVDCLARGIILQTKIVASLEDPLNSFATTTYFS